MPAHRLYKAGAGMTPDEVQLEMLKTLRKMLRLQQSRDGSTAAVGGAKKRKQVCCDIATLAAYVS